MTARVRADVRQGLRAAALALAPLALVAAAAPYVPVGEGERALFIGAVVAFAAATTTVVTGPTLAPREALARPRVAALAVAAGVALSLASRLAPAVGGGLVGALGLLTAACAVGSLVGSKVESPGHILPVALLSAGVDLWSVTAAVGPTHVIVNTPALLELLTVRAAVPPSRAPVPQIGFGDVVFAMLYTAVCARFELPRARTAAALALGVASAGALSMALEAPVPALPMLGLAVVAAHREARRVPARDRRATWFAAAVLLASAARAAKVALGR